MEPEGSLPCSQGPILFENTINSEHCIGIVHESLGHSTQEEIAKA
jgi:hypothetical protein